MIVMATKVAEDMNQMMPAEPLMPMEWAMMGTTTVILTSCAADDEVDDTPSWDQDQDFICGSDVQNFITYDGSKQVKLVVRLLTCKQSLLLQKHFLAVDISNQNSWSRSEPAPPPARPQTTAPSFFHCSPSPIDASRSEASIGYLSY